ncbi:ribbon-helix-helix domain-containing protein [Bradyrhizobium sp. 76]|uniref:ribbon-helix-helix domain-containing protein n=1 Tax=Bradyrhizobium sp. 76 TaxID=2782680 RepID=UPI001FF7091A|nr:ribbon-helix-helix domain-containing protein [Bradyrhizobium sp. 76]MCK1410196.1 hypothetical protein [Bradyrhizobium sp. 76]
MNITRGQTQGPRQWSYNLRMFYDPMATKFQINCPASKELAAAVDAARIPMRLSRAEFTRRALQAYVEQASRKVA